MSGVGPGDLHLEFLGDVDDTGAGTTISKYRESVWLPLQWTPFITRLDRRIPRTVYQGEGVLTHRLITRAHSQSFWVSRSGLGPENLHYKFLSYMVTLIQGAHLQTMDLMEDKRRVWQ